MLDSIETFEIKARTFQRMTGLLAPGKDVPAADGRNDMDTRQRLWDLWNMAYGSAVGQAMIAYGEIMLAPERMTLPDWRVGLSVKPKMLSHPLWRQIGQVISVHPDGYFGFTDPTGVLRIQMDSGQTFLERADNWVTA